MVKSRKSNVGLFQPILPGTPPPTPDRDDYFPLPPRSSDFNFLKPELPPKPAFFPKPTIDNFARHLTKIVDEENNTIEITPKKPQVNFDERNLSEQLQEIFPDINQVIEEDDVKFKENIENLTKILTKIGEDDEDTLFELEFFVGGKNKKFDDHICGLGFSTDILEFLDFIQSNQCKQILINNKLKIHIETGNIYYDNKDTNEWIFYFFLNQQNPINGIIKFDFIYDESYNNYFHWLINGFDSYQNVKFLFYRFNDFLNESNVEIKKVKHSSVTDDYIAAKEIQNQNWQYFFA